MRLRHPILSVCLLALPLFVFAQTPAFNCCFYQLELRDDFGDGWSGASLVLEVGNNTEIFTLDATNDNGANELFPILVQTGDSVKVTFNSGNFDNEISYALRNSEGSLLFESQGEPTEGLVYSSVAACSTCPILTDEYLTITDIRAVTTTIDLLSCTPDATYLIEYDESGYEQGTATFSRLVPSGGTDIQLTGLNEKTTYDLYVSLICASGDTTEQVGPFTFETLYKVDVGIVDISTPSTDCELGESEILTVTIANFGADPLSLIPFNFSVNGIPGGVSQPQDGYFTGVIGKDSTFTIPFETLFDFSVPQEYEILAWTELQEDSDNGNDTTRVLVTNVPRITNYPYFTDFEQRKDGWTVDENSAQASWDYGMPDGTLINAAASGDLAWVTRTDGAYNANEFSYLVSPCLDFSSLTVDPLLAFSLQFSSEALVDGGWVEISTNGGLTYDRLGAAETGLNWYNDQVSRQWEGDGGFDGWVVAMHPLEGTAGLSDVRLRFVFRSDATVQFDGMAIDNILITPPMTSDVAAVTVTNERTAGCGQAEDKVTLTVVNLGVETATVLDMSYRINGGELVTEVIDDLELAPGETASYTFEQSFNSTAFQTYTIDAFVNSAEDGFAANNATRTTFATSTSSPYLEDFERGLLPNGWSVAAENGEVSDGHDAGSFVLTQNMSVRNRLLLADSPTVGPIFSTDSVAFDYRFVELIGETIVPYNLTTADSLTLLISTDCGITYEPLASINATNHISTADYRTFSFSLADYTGAYVNLRLTSSWVSGEYFIDIDKVRIYSCLPDLGLRVSSSDETTDGAADGSASVRPTSGTGPYRYAWSNGDTRQTIPNLAAGEYTVTVTDVFGCSDVASVNVDLSLSAANITALQRLQLFPNPMTDQAQLVLDFSESVALEWRVTTVMGQVLTRRSLSSVRTGQYTIDLSTYPTGIYLLQLVIDGETHTERLLKW